jgi:hypothetical protein
MEPLPSEPKSLESKLESNNVLVTRFIVGAAIGLAIAATYWGTTIYFSYPVSLNTGIIGCLLLATICGLMTLKWGYKILENFLENLR